MVPSSSALTTPLYATGPAVPDPAIVIVPEARQDLMKYLRQKLDDPCRPHEGVLSERLAAAVKALPKLSVIHGQRNRAFKTIAHTQVALDKATGEDAEILRRQQMTAANAFLDKYGHGKNGYGRLVQLVEAVRMGLMIGKDHGPLQPPTDDAAILRAARREAEKPTSHSAPNTPVRQRINPVNAAEAQRRQAAQDATSASRPGGNNLRDTLDRLFDSPARLWVDPRFEDAETSGSDSEPDPKADDMAPRTRPTVQKKDF